MSVRRQKAKWGWFLALAVACACGDSPGPQDASLPELPELSFEGAQPEAREHLQSALEKARRAPSRPEPVGRLGMLLEAHGRLESAASCYERAAALAPADERWTYYLGSVRYELNQDREAVQPLRRALELKPGYLPAQLKLAEALRSLGEVEAARILLEQVVRIHPDSAIAYYRLGDIESSLGATRDAIALYERAVALSPSYAAAHYALGQTYREQGRLEQAQLHLSRFEQNKNHKEPLPDPLLYEINRLRSDSAPAAAAQEHFERGLSLADAGDYAAAAQELERSLEMRPDLMQARVNLIPIYAAAGEYEKAREHYRLAAAAEPQQTDLHFNFGVMVAQQGRWQEAEQAFRQVIASDPRNAAAISHLGQALEAQGRPEEALRQYRAAVESDAANREARFHLGRLLMERGRTDESLRHFRQTLAPVDERTPQYAIDTAIAYARAGRLDEAQEYAQLALDKAKLFGQRETAQLAERVLQKLENDAGK